MNSIPSLLHAVVSELSALKRPVVEWLNPGRPEAIISREISRLGLKATDDLIALYAIYNGTTVREGALLDDAHFFPGFYWFQLEDAIECYSALSKDSRWNPMWFPIFANGGGDFYAVCCDKADKNFGAIIGFLLGEPNSQVEFPGLKGMLSWMSHCFRERIFFVLGGTLEADFQKAEEVATAIRVVN